MIVVDTSDGVTANGYTPPNGEAMHILPFGSHATFNWDFINDEFYEPLPTLIALDRGNSVDVPYTITGDFVSGVTLTGSTLSAADDAALGDFTVTLTDPATNRTAECVISVKDAPAPPAS
jgi:hypothetical protein